MGLSQNRLAGLREVSGWNRCELADYLEVDERTLCVWEAGESSIPNHQQARLCDLYGVSLGHLMGQDAPTHPPPVEPLRLVS